MNHYVITIGREFGSGGRRIGRHLAAELGIPCYDRHLIEEAEELSGIGRAELEKADEMAAHPLLYSIPNKPNPFTGYGKPMNDTLFAIQSHLIQNYADQGPCMIIGRCADRVLEGREHKLSIFIYAPAEVRIGELMSRYRTDREEAAYLMRQADRIRKNYYSHYAKKKWGDRSSYDLMIDSSRFTEEEVAAMIRGILTERLRPLDSREQTDASQKREE